MHMCHGFSRWNHLWPGYRGLAARLLWLGLLLRLLGQLSERLQLRRWLLLGDGLRLHGHKWRERLELWPPVLRHGAAVGR